MLERHVNAMGLVWYQSAILNRLAVPHAFSTRLGGVSAKPFESLNFQPADSDVSHLETSEQGVGCGTSVPIASPDEQDVYACVRENTNRLATAIGRPDSSVRCIWQVHGTGCVVFPHGIQMIPSHSPSVVAKADALITCHNDSLIAVRVADCVPILLADESGTCVAAVHAGWRGVVDPIVPAAVTRLCELAGCSSSKIVAAIGPCISAEHFEVGSEVAEAFAKADLNEVIVDRKPRPHIDLPAAIALQLQRVGVQPSNIDRTDRCTFRDESEFFSHRRDHGRTGRMCAIIGCCLPKR